MDPVDKVYQLIEEAPKVTCAKCGKEKFCCLFTPSQLKRGKPRCRMCCASPRGGK